MPYGIWTEQDGSKVLFSRDYCPLWKIQEGRAPERDEPNRWVNVSKEEWILDETDFHSSPTDAIEKGFEILREHRIVSLPHLVDWLPKCLAEGKQVSDYKYLSLSSSVH